MIQSQLKINSDNEKTNSSWEYPFYWEYHHFIETFIKSCRKIMLNIEDATEMKKLKDIILGVAQECGKNAILSEMKLGELLEMKR